MVQRIQRMWFFFYGQKETWQHGEHSFARTGAQKNNDWQQARSRLDEDQTLHGLRSVWPYAVGVGPQISLLTFWDFSSFLGVHIRLLDSRLQAKHGRKSSRVVAKSIKIPWFMIIFAMALLIFLGINTIIITV